MPWIIPSASQISERMAGVIEAGMERVAAARGLVLDPVRLSLAVRSARGVWAQITRAVALEIREIHDHVAYQGRQMFIDLADDDNVPRHGSMWGVDRRQPLQAVGAVLVSGAPGLAVASGLGLSSAEGVLYQTTAAATIGTGGTAVIPAEAISGGVAGNLASGVRLSVINMPAVTDAVVSTGFAGGADEQSIADWRDAILDRIRRPPHGGAVHDYQTWVAEAADVMAVKVLSGWVGNGSLALVIAMPDPASVARAPTSAELAAIGAYIEGVRPVTAQVVEVAATMRLLTPIIRLRPDTTATRAAVTDAWRRYVLSIGDEEDEQNTSPIGALIEPSRIVEALSAAAGEYAHDLIEPSAPLTLGPTEYPLAGTITWVA